MKKLFFLLFMSTTVGACNFEQMTNDGSGSGTDSGVSINTIVEDSSGKRLGILVEERSSYLFLFSPKGYYYRIGYNGNIYPPSILLTHSKSTIDKNNLFHNAVSDTLYKKSVYMIKSTTGGLPTGELFCNEAGYAQHLGSGYYWWTADDDASDFTFMIEVPVGMGVGVKITSCSYDQVGLPQNIQPPIKMIE